MPFELLEQDGYLLLRYFGLVVEDDLRLSIERMEEMETGPRGAKHRLTDLTEVDDVSVGFPEVFEVARKRTRRKLHAYVKSAVVARRPMHVGYARMFQTLNENPNIEVRVVETFEEALLWFKAG